MSTYSDNTVDQFVIREFSEHVTDDELVWHRDKRNRVILPMRCDGWLFQIDNLPPEELIPNVSIFVEREKYHRLIKGRGPLILKILEQ